MLEISELIYETCKTYLLTQGKFLLILEVFIGAAIIFYFGFLVQSGSLQGRHHSPLQPDRYCRQLFGGVVRNSREYVRELPHRICKPSRQAVSVLRHSAAGRHEHRHAADQRRAVPDVVHPAVRSR